MSDAWVLLVNMDPELREQVFDLAEASRINLPALLTDADDD